MGLTLPSATNGRPRIRRYFSSNWIWLLALCFVVTLVWCFAYHRWSQADWSTPLLYSGDGMSGLAGGKALATGELWPLLPKNPPSFGAPFVANWNDYPSVEEGILAWWMIFVRLFGVFVGTNLTVLSAHLLAALSFYFVCWQLGYRRIFAAGLAILFALSRYSFARGFGHIVLTFYWHVPLGLLVAWWCLAREPLLAQRRRFLFACGVAVIHGVQNPYYSWIFCQFVGLAALYQFFRRQGWRAVLGPVIILAVVAVTFLVMNLDTAYYRWQNGPPPTTTVIRNYSGLEVYALKPVELLLPPVHSIPSVQAWAHTVYFDQAYIHGEVGPAYLGAIGVIALAMLLWSVLRNLSRGQTAKVPVHFWGLSVIFAYSAVGGLNGVLGLFGLVLFRCTNRFSIVILAIVLLFLARQLTSFSRRWPMTAAAALAVAMLAIGIFDQLLPRQREAGLVALRQQVATDAAFTAKMEARLPPAAAVFELPVMDYPEVPPVLGITDYEEFRPYLYSRHLRYSYGSDKGRYREAWQHEVGMLGVERMARSLESYGFAAVLINRKGYEDRGASLIQGLANANRSEVIAENSDLVAVALAPSPRPCLPPEFGRGWYGLETNATDNWRWADGSTSVILYGSPAAATSVRVQFALSALRACRITVIDPKGTVYDKPLTGGALEPMTLTVQLSPGRNELRFQTDTPGALPGTGDPRKLAFAVHDFQVTGL